MDSRRNFIGKFATGLAGTIASPTRVLGANDRIRIGVVGVGDRGLELLREALACEQTEIAAAADIDARRRENAQAAAPGLKLLSDYRLLLADPSIDAVIIATPPHLHAEQAIAAISAGKHIYLERPMALAVEDAVRLKAAGDAAPQLTIQIGHQSCSWSIMRDAVEMAASGRLGQITEVRAHCYRNSPRGRQQWVRPVYPGLSSDSIDWAAYSGRDWAAGVFDADRFVNWRLYWDYSGGGITENMSQQFAFWYRALGLDIPQSVTAAGGNYLSTDSREIPDTMSVVADHGGLMFRWDSGAGNNHFGMGEAVLGTDGTLVKNQQLVYTPQKANRPKDVEMTRRGLNAPRAHMQNFLDSIRAHIEPNCSVDLGYRTSIACAMAIRSLREKRTVRWDAGQLAIV
jgi:predicted dehydrogenase